MEGMNGSNCHPGLDIIAERGEEDQEQPKPFGAAGTESDTDEGKTVSSSGGTCQQSVCTPKMEITHQRGVFRECGLGLQQVMYSQKDSK